MKANSEVEADVATSVRTLTVWTSMLDRVTQGISEQQVYQLRRDVIAFLKRSITRASLIND